MEQNINVAFIESTATYAQELATQLHAASDDESRDEVLERLNRVLNDIIRAAKGELGDDECADEDEDKAVICCTQCAIKYPNDPVKYQSCMSTCNKGC